MRSKSNSLPITLLGLFLLCAFNFSCTKEPDLDSEITGEYCTFRDGLNGPVSSQVSIAVDSTQNFDYIISNISGYPNSSQAFLNIGCERVLDRLVILEYSVPLGLSTMSVSGDGDILEDGTIHFEFTITLDEETHYELFLNSNTSIGSGTFSDDSNSITIDENEMTFALSVNDNPYNFKINQLDNSGCGINVPRQSTINLENDESLEIESELFYTGNRLLGEIRMSNDNWQNEETIELELQ